jgi:heme A synthase
VHAHGGEVAIGLCVLALIAAAVQLRSRRDLLVGNAVLLVLLIVEAYLGGRITNDGNDLVTAVHIPLALVLMGLAVWLPFRARQARARTPESN